MAGTELYIKLVVGFARDPKVRALARYGVDAGLARDLYVQMCLHCKESLTDGFVLAEEVGALAYPLPIEHANQLAKQLASVGLIKEVSKDEAQGWHVLAFLKRNRSKGEVEALSEVRAEAGRTGGLKSRKPAKAAGQRGSRGSGKQVANQGASKLPARVQSTEDIDASNEASSSAASPPDANPGTVVGAYVDGARDAGQPDPAASLRARVGKQARQLLAEGYDIAALITAAKRMGAGEWNDLAVQVRKDAAASNGQGSGAPGPDRARGWMAAGRAFQEQMDQAGKELPGGR